MMKLMETKTITLDEERNVKLTCYLQPAGGKFSWFTERPALLILPGGAYEYCSEREADPVAFRFLAAGFQVFILEYSVGDWKAWPAPLLDYDNAMALIRQRAGEWQVDPDRIAVCGFSAGGHLAAAAAAMSVNRPNAALLGYAVATADVQACLPNAPDVTEAVDGTCAPCFIFAARDDAIVPVTNSLRMAEALTKAGITYELHIYAQGGHGFTTADPAAYTPAEKRVARLGNWVDDGIAFLGDIFGRLEADGNGNVALGKPAVPAKLLADDSAFLSVDNTVGRILSVPDGSAVLLPLLEAMRPGTADELNGDGPAVRQLRTMKLRDVLYFAGAPQDAVEKLDGKLKEIPNVPLVPGA